VSAPAPATLVVSDLHLGTRVGVDLLRAPAVLETLLAELSGVQRLVLLGDVIELRTGPQRQALEAARPVLCALGAAVEEVVVVPGNHDHALVAPWLEQRAGEDPDGLGAEQLIGAGQASPLGAALADALRPAATTFAYPGLWLAPGVYAMHGHYVDRHLTLPAFERLGLGLVERYLAGPAARRPGSAGYEAVHAPLYALLDALAQQREPSGDAERPGASVRTWRRLARGERRLAPSTLALRVGVGLGVAALNRAGMGPLSPRLGAPELRQAVLAAAGEVTGRLGIDADHVLFGHSHRPGPLPGDSPQEWRTPSGSRLHNAGSWVYQPHFLTHVGPNPFWPGGALRLPACGAPVLRRLLIGWGRAELTDAVAEVREAQAAERGMGGRALRSRPRRA